MGLNNAHRARHGPGDAAIRYRGRNHPQPSTVFQLIRHSLRVTLNYLDVPDAGAAPKRRLEPDDERLHGMMLAAGSAMCAQ